MKKRILRLVLKVREAMGLPGMTDKEIQFIKHILLSRKKIKVFEYGTGNSTVYFTKFLIKNNIQFTWETVDHNPYWTNKIKEKAPWVTFHTRPTDFKYDDPIVKRDFDYIRAIQGEFDLILIDGCYRGYCFEHAKDHTKSLGTIIVLDAQRSHYKLGKLAVIKDHSYLESGKYHPWDENRKILAWNKKR